MHTITLVDDDHNILTSVSMALEAEGYRTQTYADGDSALSAMKNSPPDAVILDINMPRMDGMELLRQLRETLQLPVILLSAKNDDCDELLGFKMGADDFIRKPFSQRVLTERVRVLLRRSRAIGSGVNREPHVSPIRCGRLLIDVERHICTWDTYLVVLTAKEFQILKSLAQWPGIIRSRKQLMDAVYEVGIYVEDRNVDSHIKRLRRKFKTVDRGFNAIETVYGLGYRFIEI